MQKHKNTMLMRVNGFIVEHQLLSPKHVDPKNSGPEGFNLKPFESTVIIVGLSGGPDSVFLLHVLYALRSTYNLTLIAAHLDHGWRENSQEDLIFCQNLAHALNIEFVSAHASQIKIDTHKKKSGSREDLGRQMRRVFFAECMQKYNACAVALAHHQDDQIETFMMRLIRGTGVTGLACMRPRAGFYIRPLLAITKSEILAYLEEKSIAYVVDHTNFTDEHLRNRIRKQVIPALNLADKRFETSCIRTIKNMQEHEAFLENLTRTTFADITYNTKDASAIIETVGAPKLGANLPGCEASKCKVSGYKASCCVLEEPLCLDLKKFRALDPFMQKRVLMHLLCYEKVAFTPSEKFFAEIMRFMHQGAGGMHAIHPSWSIKKIQKCFCIVKK